MTRLTDEQITQKAREAYATDNGWSDRGRTDVLAGQHDRSDALKRIRAAIIATLTEYAPHLLPRDPDEELADMLYAQWRTNIDNGVTMTDLALYVIKHMRESGK